MSVHTVHIAWFDNRRKLPSSPLGIRNSGILSENSPDHIDPATLEIITMDR